MSEQINVYTSNRFKYKGGKVGPFNPSTIYDVRHHSVERARKFLTASLVPSGEIHRAVRIIWAALINTAKENRELLDEIDELKQKIFQLQLGK